MKKLSLFLLLALASCLRAQSSPAAHVISASRSVRTLDKDEAYRTRYISSYHRTTDKAILEDERVGNFLLNSVSREGSIKKMTRVTKGLWRIDLADYKFDPKLWEKLLDVEPFWHVPAVDLEKGVKEEYVEEKTGRRISFDGGRTFQDEVRRVKKQVEAKKQTEQTFSPWLPLKESADLVLLTKSNVPIVRLDWLLYQIGASDRRKLPYNEILGFKNEKEFQLLGGADVKVAQKLGLDQWAVVGRSTVTLNA